MASFSDRLKQLRTEKGLLQRELAEHLKLSRVAITQYENGNRVPDQEIINKIADYFDVSLDYLMGKTNIRNITSNQLTKNDEKDIAKDLDKIMNRLKNEQGLMFDGEPADEETLNALREALEMGMRYAKAVNKKYTPKKYRKKDN